MAVKNRPLTLSCNAFRQLSADKQSHAGAVDGSTPKVTYSYESGGTKNSIRRISTTYPTSSRVVEVKYGAANSMDDHLSRVSALQVTGETDELVNYTYCGQAWQVRVGYPTPGVELKYRRLSGEPVGDAGDPYSGYDRFGRTVDMPWIKTSDGSIVERSQYGFDRNSRRTWQKRPLTDTQDQQYGYDALSQVNAAARGSLNLNATAISGIPGAAESWDYDPTGNWRGYHSAANGTATLDQHRVHDRGNRLTQIEDNPNNMILDRVGRMRQTAPDAGGDWDGTLEITWDAWSRITSVRNNGTEVGNYSYDGTYRRITREVDGETLHIYYNDAWRPVEERKDSETTASISYLWGARHRDDLVRRDRAVGGTTLNETRYILMDYFNPAAVTDAAGEVTERYTFSAFGVRTILNPDYTERSSSECGMEFGFQGQFLDIESGLMNYGYRYYSPYLGRWMCKDPIGENGGLNLYESGKNNLIDGVDYLGLKKTTVKTTAGPEMRKCGGFSWTVEFGADPAAKGGYFVQQLSIEFQVKDCDGNPIAEKKLEERYEKRWGKYLEDSFEFTTSGRGQIGLREAFPASGPKDTFQDVGFGKCTQGSVTVKASVRYYPDIEKLPTSFKPNNPRTFGGGAPSTIEPTSRDNPRLTGGYSSAPHNLSITWNCCTKDASGEYQETDSVLQSHDPQ